MKRWALVVSAALLCAAVAPSLPASAASTTTTVDLVSGVPTAEDYSPAPDTQFSDDGGATWADAINYNNVGPWGLHDIPGASWVTPPYLGDNGGRDMPYLFRRTFELPAAAVGSSFRVCYHTDNAGSVSLNGTELGAQPDVETWENYWGPPTCFDAPATLLVPGENTLLFTVHNYGNVTGVVYDATVAYQDRVNTPPVLHLPGDLNVDATGPQGAVVPFTATATDDTGATVACDHAPDSVFPIATTTVNCTATDDDGATSTGSFAVHVRGAQEQLADLLTAVVDSGYGPGQSLAARLRGIIDGLQDPALPPTCEPLRAFATTVNALSAPQIPQATAAEWVADATRIRAVLGCR